MLAYAWCRAHGYPIGSGNAERAYKLVAERRLKGTGRPWAREHYVQLAKLADHEPAGIDKAVASAPLCLVLTKVAVRRNRFLP
jgi:hypothetical protein